MVALAACRERSQAPLGEERSTVCIHRFEQFVHTFRTQVTSLHHNFSAALADSFGISWRPTSEPVWLLGRRYKAPAECGEGPCPEFGRGRHAAGQGRPCERSQTAPGAPEDFAAAWGQISRMTYRKGFAPMYRCVRSPSGGSEDRRYIRLTSDAGWGCMIRVGQMLLATALKHHFSRGGAPGSSHDAGAALRDGGGSAGEDGEEAEASRSGGKAALPALEMQFLDDPCPKRSPFSIFGFVRAAHGREVVVPPGGEEAAVLGATLAGEGVAPTRQLTQKLPGDWFGPTTISETIAALVERSLELREGLAVYVDADGILYEDEVRALAGAEEPAVSSPPTSPVLVASSCVGKPRASTSGRCGGGDSDEEFMVLSTASVSGASATSPRNSMAPADMSQSLVSSPILASDPGGEFEEARCAGADVLQVGSFQELQPPNNMEFCSALQLPPPALPDGGGACPLESASWSEATPTPARWRRAVLLLFPLQLGCEKYVGEAHVEALLKYFELKSSLGAMGGRPRMAHFFVGKQGRGLLYVDPHVVQPAAVSCDEGEASEGFVGTETFHNTPTVQVIPVEQIDSSISLAFYCRGEAELRELLEDLRRIDASEADAPVHVEKTRPLALRTPQANGLASVLWCDSDSLAASFTEVSRRDELEQDGEAEQVEELAPQATPSRPRCIVVGGGAVGDDCLLEFQREDEEMGGAKSVGVGGGGLALGPAGRALCVGAPWADGPWAEVEEEGDVVIEPGL